MPTREDILNALKYLRDSTPTLIIEAKYKPNTLVYILNVINNEVIPGHIKSVIIETNSECNNIYSNIRYKITTVTKQSYIYERYEDDVYTTAEEAQQASKPEH